MSEEPEVQRTPGGHEIPVPSRDEVFRDLAKLAKSKRPERDTTADDDSTEGPHGRE